MSKAKRKFNFRGKTPTSWDPWEIGISPSFITNWLTCREQTRLGYVEGWRTPPTMPTMFGGICHESLRYLCALGKKPRTIDVRKSLKHAYSKILEEQKGGIRSTRVREMFDDAKELANITMPNYVLRYAGDFPGGKYLQPVRVVKPKKWIELEKFFSVPFQFKDGKKINLIGLRDAIFEDASKREWILDTKTSGRFERDLWADTLPKNLQLLFYAYARFVEKGKPPAGIVVNMIRRPGQKGKAGETPKQLLARIEDEMSSPKNWDHYFVRMELRLLRKELIAWRDDFLSPVMEEIRMWFEGKIPHYYNPLNLVGKYGRCRFFDLMMSGSTIGLSRDRRHDG